MYAKKSGTGLITSVLLPIGFICLFTFCSLALALMGSKVYKGVNESITESFSTSVAASYLRTKLLQYNSVGAVDLKEMDGMQILVLTAQREELTYSTYIYVWENQLMEALVVGEDGFAPVDGMLITQLKNCEFNMDKNGLFTAYFENMAGDKTRTTFALLQGGSE